MNFKAIHIIIGLLLVTNILTAQRQRLRNPMLSRIEDYPKVSEKILQELENHGYPFATVRLQSADPEHGDLTPILIIDTNIFVTFDSIVCKGDVKLSEKFLYPYLGLKRGTPYNENLLQQVNEKLLELPFATILRNAEVSFVKDKAYLYVYLDPRRTNQFDGYIGFAPSDEKTGKLTVNGDLKLDMQNLFRIGESISLHWYSSERYSQHLQIGVRFPYLFRTRFGIEGSFNLDKEDTSFLTLNGHIGIPYSFLNNSYIVPYYDFTRSTQLSKGTNETSSDNCAEDFRKNRIGLKLHYRKLDYLFNPRKGIDVQTDLSAGRRTLLPQGGQPDAAIVQKTTYRVYGRLQGYIPLGKHWVFTPKIVFESPLEGPQYYNELTKIGGEKGLRGFNPNDISASTYLLYSGEIRYLFGRKSFANIFFDGATYEQRLTNNGYMKDLPFGFGAGVHLAVRSGIFYLEYALGRQLKNPIQLKTGKIHFGIKVEF